MDTIQVIVVALLSSNILILVIKHVIGLFTKMNATKIKHSKIKVNVLSPIVQYMTSIDFLNNNLTDIFEHIEENLYKKYDYIAPYIIHNFSKLKVKKAKGEITTFSTNDFFKLYFAIQKEYNMARKNLSMDYDIQYTNTDISVYSRYNLIICAIWGVLYFVIIIILWIDNQLEGTLIINFTNAIGFLAFSTVALMGILFVLNIFTTQRHALKVWKSLISIPIKEQISENDNNGCKNDDINN